MIVSLSNARLRALRTLLSEQTPEEALNMKMMHRLLSFHTAVALPEASTAFTSSGLNPEARSPLPSMRAEALSWGSLTARQ